MRDISMPRLLAADLDDRSVNLASYGRSVFFDQLFHIILWACGLIGFLLPVLIIGYLLIHGSHSLSWAFLFDHPRGAPLGTAGGIGPAIQGSFALALCGLLMAFPLALAGGVYLSEYGRSRIFNDSARFIVECLAAVPSVIYGLFGYAFLVVFLKFGISLLAGSIVLALIMFPIMLISIQEAFRAVDPGYRETALSLGVTRWYLVRKILLPKAWPGIVAGVVLAVGHAVGSAAPVLFTASIYFSKGGLKLEQPVMTLPTHLYHLVSEAISFDQAYGTALVLIIGLLLFNMSALLIRKIGGAAST
jgi:phosphate transport system permease protein